MAKSDARNGQPAGWAWPVGILLGLVIGLTTLGGAGGVALGVGVGLALALAFGAASRGRESEQGSDRP